MSTLRVTGLKQETSTATNISLAVGGGVTVAGISTFYNNTIFTNDVTVTGNISVGGTLTYQDVTDVDSIGIITARNGIHVSGGNVGIGTDSPQTLQHLKSDDPTIRIQRNNQSAYGDITADTSGKIVFKSDPSGAASGDGFSFTVNNTERLRINSNGTIGINTTSDNSLLTIESPAFDPNESANFLDNDSSASIVLTSNTGWAPDDRGGAIKFAQRWWDGNASRIATGAIYGYKRGNNGSFGGGLSFATSANTENRLEERLTIDHVGRVIVGITSDFVTLPSSSTSNSSGGTSASQGVLHLGFGGPIVSRYARLPAGDYMDLTINTASSGIFTGILCLTVADISNGSNRRGYVYSVHVANQYNAFNAVQLQTQTNGSGTNFSFAYVATGKLRITNTASITEEIAATFIGALC